MSKAVIKACPFCGSEGLVNRVTNGIQNAWCVCCSGEHDTDCTGQAMNGWRDDRKDAIMAWNMRSEA
jgi:hypothetical protein